ncbi:winged helix-turn-helix domain-containing protein [Citrobacter cronae]|uniref:winged helix-turn-helix domain-containing protein n=1 Tax=Citrobacter cronae TaxID=1748967 RepID=UPI0021D3E3B1|nr:winged helix-turn-helix domain-containing protein [Citrobacter cronae]MCU6173803.1 winged helix-turn-helix domain-containing protein [Citrobacter cronae]
MKQYRINNTIIYNESLRELTSLQDKTIIKMTHMRAQCLSFLLRNAKLSLITREMVTEAVWGQKGKFISDASLTQLLYLLRRDLKQIGLDELFTTLPRQGLKINDDINITFNDTPPRYTSSAIKNKTFQAIFLITLLAIMSLIFFTYI